MSPDPSALVPTTGRWNIDQIHSTALFSIRHHGVSTFRAGFSEISGAYDADAGELIGEVKVANIQAPVSLLHQHLQSPDFFDAERNPTLSFQSGPIVPDADGTFSVQGDLTIRGISKHLTADGVVRRPFRVAHPDGSEADHFGIDLQTTIDRRDYGVDFNGPLPRGGDALGWDVTIQIALELIEGQTFLLRDFQGS